MRKLLVMMVVGCMVLIGCTAITFERKVEDNTFISMGSPNLQVQVSPEFRYIGQVSSSKHNQKVGGVRGLLVNYNSYLFADIGDDNIIKRGVIIRVDKVGKSYWDADLFAEIKNKIVSDYFDINNERYEHVIAVRSDIFTQDEIDYIIQEGLKNEKAVIRNKKLTYSGYSIPKCFIMEAFGIRSGAGYDTKLTICYYQDLSAIDESFTCREMTKGDISAEDQEKAKKTLMELRKKAITFIKYKN